jgi:CO/xanthine dehydrogenase FAD-binding subunit
MKLPAFHYACPATLDEAVALLASRDDAKALAGGQSLVPMMAFRVASPSLLVDLRKLADLRRIEIMPDCVHLGAMTRWRDILDDARLDTAHPLLKAAIAHVAHYQIRNRGTVGGSLALADPAAEMPGIAVACDAEIAVVGAGGAGGAGGSGGAGWAGGPGTGAAALHLSPEGRGRREAAGEGAASDRSEDGPPSPGSRKRDPTSPLRGEVKIAAASGGAGGAAGAGGGGARTIRAADFFIAPLVTALAADEIIVGVRLPSWPPGRRWGFQEFSLRRGDFALAAAAVFYDLDDGGRACNAHVGVIGVGDVPQRLAAAEAEINGTVVALAVAERAGLAASAAVNPPDDIHASSAYRRSLAGTMVERALLNASTATPRQSARQS